jgi:glycosyltransferase involved in cell wall biosynthesis
MTISFVIPSINRESLKRTIDSIEVRVGDEILVEFDLPKSGDWGNSARNRAIARATGDYLAFIDDDDYYVQGHREIMERAIKENPGKPNLFKIQYPNGELKWKAKEIVPGNISTQMILIPNSKWMFDKWVPKRNMADFIFVDTWSWPDDMVIWRDEIICLMNHNDGENLNLS